MAAAQYVGVLIEAKYTLGLAKVRSGSWREGLKLCEEAAKLAQNAGDTGLISRAILAHAEAALENGDNSTALELAVQSHGRFNAAGQQESEWRALLLAGRASQRLGNQESSQLHYACAREILGQLAKRWDQDIFRQYLSRPDIQFYRNLLG